MKAHIIIAEAGSSHSDGSFSLLKAGTTEVTMSPTDTVGMETAIAIWVRGDSNDYGNHTFRLQLVDSAGGAVGPDVTGSFSLTREQPMAHTLLRCALDGPRFGDFTFIIRIDEKPLDTWPFRISVAPAMTGMTAKG